MAINEDQVKRDFEKLFTAMADGEHERASAIAEELCEIYYPPLDLDPELQFKDDLQTLIILASLGMKYIDACVEFPDRMPKTVMSVLTCCSPRELGEVGDRIQGRLGDTQTEVQAWFERRQNRMHR